MTTPIPLFFLIRNLDVGGAERQLTELVRGLARKRFTITVVTLYDAGELASEVQGLDGVTIVSLHKKSRWDLVPILWRLWRLLRKAKPQVIHSYMGGANEIALLLGKMAGVKVVWGIRCANVDYSRYGWLSGWSFRMSAVLSAFVDLIIVNSQAGVKHHTTHGYCSKRMVVINNGIDTERFSPDLDSGLRMRAEWGVKKGDKLIGLVGRLDPMKGHPVFLRAAALLSSLHPAVRFVVVGDGDPGYRGSLEQLADELALKDCLVWGGAQGDMRAVYNALDIATSSSLSEGFSNVVAEAMACGVPCVVTDVGDSAMVVGHADQVIPVDDPKALADAWLRVLNLPDDERALLGVRASRRIAEEFSVRRLVEKTESHLLRLLQ